MHTASILSPFVCICAYVCHYQPFTMQQDFEGGVYWDELAVICSGIFEGGRILRCGGNMIHPVGN